MLYHIKNHKYIDKSVNLCYNIDISCTFQLRGDRVISLEICPKCEGKAKLIWGPHNFRANPPKKGHKQSTFALVQCLNCNFKTKTYKPVNGESAEVLKERAILAWNLLPRESNPTDTASDT